MKKWFVTTVAVFVSLVGLTASTAAQKGVVLDTNPPPAAPTRSLVKTSGTAKAEYDKYKDATFARSQSISLKIGETGWGSLSAGFTSKGNGVAKPDKIFLYLFTASKDRSFVDKPDATISADDLKIFDGKAEITDARTNGIEVYTSLDISLSLGDFERIIRAERFSVSAGPSRWLIPKSEISKFSDLLGLF